MKQVLEFIMLGIVATLTSIAQAQQMSEEMLRERILDICSEFGRYGRLPENARERALEGGVSPEWMTGALENMVRKSLPVMTELKEKGGVWYFSNGMPPEYRTVHDAACDSLIMLREFPGPNTLALLRECAFSFEYYEAYDAVIDTYIALEGGDSVPFLRELLEKKIPNRYLAQCLRGPIIEFKKKNRNGDVDKFHAFLLEQLQAEQIWSSVEQIDGVLCMTLDGYPESIQRREAMQRFADMPDNMPLSRQRHSEIQATIDAVPADRRTDLGGRFTGAGLGGGADGEDGGTGTPPSSRTWLRLALALLALALLAGSAAAWRKAKRK